MASLSLSGQRAKTTNNQQTNNSSTEKGVRMWRVRAGSEGCSRDAVDRTPTKQTETPTQNKGSVRSCVSSLPGLSWEPKPKRDDCRTIHSLKHPNGSSWALWGFVFSPRTGEKKKGKKIKKPAANGKFQILCV
jgi:hypothetical protein